MHAPIEARGALRRPMMLKYRLIHGFGCGDDQNVAVRVLMVEETSEVTKSSDHFSGHLKMRKLVF